MYYKLAEHLLLRGWEYLPYGLTDTKNGRTRFFDKQTYALLLKCDGQTNLAATLDTILEDDCITKLVDSGLIVPCSEGDTLYSGQAYHSYPCRFMDSAHWAITGRCNYRCRHCYLSAPDARYGELSTAECLQVIDQLASAGIARVNLTGGEALLRPDLLSIINALQARHIQISQIYTNGAFVSDALLDALENRGLTPEFSISFDGVGYHDWLRGVNGAEERTLAAIRLLHSRHFFVSVEMAMHQLNKNTLAPTVELLARSGVAALKVSPVYEAGAWLKEDKSYSLSPSELYEAFLDYIPRFRRSGAPLKIQLGGVFSALRGSDTYTIPYVRFEQASMETVRCHSLCRSVRNQLYISADGTVLPCAPMSGSCIEDGMPNLLTTNLTAILSNSVYLKTIDRRIRDLEKNNTLCRACPFLSECGGSCRAIAVMEQSKYYGEDHWACYFFRNGYKERVRQQWESALL